MKRQATIDRARPRRPRSRPPSISTAPAPIDIATGIGFLDHMLEQLARHSLIDITLEGQGRPAHRFPPHHRGHRHRAGPGGGQGARRQAGDCPLRRRAPADGRDADARRRRRLGSAVPDLEGGVPAPKIGEMDTELFREWFQAFAQNAGITLHVENLYGENSHHIAETCFKGLARALREAIAIDPRQAGRVPSTKGTL